MRKSVLVVLAVGLVVAIGVTGCATKTYVQEQVAASAKTQDAKIGEVQKQVEATQMDVSNLKQSDAAQNEQLAKLSDTAKEALARAEEAGKLANHSFLYEVTLTDDAVHFGFNKSELSADAKAALDAFAKRVKDENKNVYVEIQGNTDSVGSEQYNLQLGQARAEAVVRYLNMQAGFPLNRMNAISYGKYKPIADNKAAEGRAKNRRVTLVVMN
jgi:outer membrane protein OmpA-like peptidoglycan-associated protein